MVEITDKMIEAIRAAAMTGRFDGRETPTNYAYLRRCTTIHLHSGAQIIYSRDVGHHSSGWMKNPDYERCKHLSLSFRQPKPDYPAGYLATVPMLRTVGIVLPLAPFDLKAARQWAERILWPEARLAWIESPKTDIGRKLEVLHYRVFCDPAWQAIHPRGEVYSTEHTEPDWLSWSEIHGAGASPPSHVDAS